MKHSLRLAALVLATVIMLSVIENKIRETLENYGLQELMQLAV